jgi:phage gp29-like protein
MALKLTDLNPINFFRPPAAVTEAVAAVKREYPDEIPQGTPPQQNHTDLPVALFGSWSVPTIQNALAAMQNGNFNAAAMLTESILGDDSVQTALNGRVKGVTMRHIHAHAAEGDTGRKRAAQCVEVWKQIFNATMLDLLMTWATFMGFCVCEIQWETRRVGEEILWFPKLKIWHPQYIWYDIIRRSYVVITEEGNIWVDDEPAKWWVFAPWGEYRGWIRGALRGVAPLWMVRQYAIRDWARFSEVHGLPTKVIKAPYQSSQADKSRMFGSVRNMGANTTILMPQQAGGDGTGWELELLEAKDRAWEAFPGLADYCDRRIHITIRGTNLTSEVQGGSYAAAQVHADEDTGYADADCEKLCDGAHRLFEMFLGYNYGEAELAPHMRLEPPDNADVFQLSQTQLNVMAWVKAARENGWSIDEKMVAERYDIPLTGVSEPAVTGAPDTVPETDE